jgi:hypothetical protein
LVMQGLLLLFPLALQRAVGFGLSNNTSPFVPIYIQLSPSSHSQHLKISFHFFSPSFPGSSTSSRPFQFLSEDLFRHPILLHSLQVTQPAYPLPHYLFYKILSFIQLFQFSIRPTFPFPIFIFRTTYSSKYFPFKNKQSLFFFLRHRPCFRSICYYRSY